MPLLLRKENSKKKENRYIYRKNGKFFLEQGSVCDTVCAVEEWKRRVNGHLSSRKHVSRRREIGATITQKKVKLVGKTSSQRKEPLVFVRLFPLLLL